MCGQHREWSQRELQIDHGVEAAIAAVQILPLIQIMCRQSEESTAKLYGIKYRFLHVALQNSKQHIANI